MNIETRVEEEKASTERVEVEASALVPKDSHLGIMSIHSSN